MLIPLIRGILRWLRFAVITAITVLATVLLVFAMQARVRLPDLSAWHKVELPEEFSVARHGRSMSFGDYLRLEDRLFADMRRRVLDDPSAADTFVLGRYNPASLTARLAAGRYNRSYELVPQEIRGAALLVHGLTDSPYAMRRIGEMLHARGFYVLALRLPGHGTVPGALRNVTWEDWYAAVEMAARHAGARAGSGQPFVAAGFSTGAALLSLYSVRALADTGLPRPTELVLLSPAIGISEFAALTGVVAGLSFIPYFEKAEWLDVLPEYDPYKYNSFPVNAASQIHLLTQALQAELQKAQDAGRLHRMPRVLAFQSMVDDTITAAEVVHGLFARLPAGEHELVVFDVNRLDRYDGLIASGPRDALDRIRKAPALPFRMTLIANRSPHTRSVAAFTRAAGTQEVRMDELQLEWPPGVLSLSHVALPFAPDDPVYGLAPVTTGPDAYPLGTFAARGESGALTVPLGSLARLRSNPFFAVIEAEIEARLAPAATTATRN